MIGRAILSLFLKTTGNFHIREFNLILVHTDLKYVLHLDFYIYLL